MGGVRRRLVRLAFVLGLVSLWFPVAAAPAHADALRYVALGDSYSSGVGTRSYYSDGTDCKRSPYAYPVLVATRLGAALSFAACSGATVADVRDKQLAGLDAATNLVTVSVGGNDAGWASVLFRCAQPWPTTCWDEIESANGFIRDVLPGRLDSLFTAIRAAAPTAHVIVVGYPRLFNGEECNLAARISPGEQAELNASADLLAATIGGRARAHGFDFVDARPAFTGHSVCDDVEWINGLSNPIGESYHPNRLGQAGYADLVAAAAGVRASQTSSPNRKE
ncbi:SGNH/GDSL hydrolase family protein [Thermasporomyces composti]|jgi:lysophospholipase L1-like esterase|uniref:GDSL-like lipase/acylhydrolase family protein n=1 Tax=Thermasporomyces composti TaxID=696763 RepID=A0A3D9VFY4_THECX|nr:SGNH/GDSL hydrolase family protein [Thermasporomyces composti]REF37064.1 GDSL-like lipase/acylhydrolase family protein [Thermasporomyces composti]